MTKSGYDPKFLGDNQEVALPALNKMQQEDASAAGLLDYPHFSLLLSESRRFVYFTATNIDGKLFTPIPRSSLFPGGQDVWSLDPRAIPDQWGDELYLPTNGAIQRGHMTKREDPQWGATKAEAKEASVNTFHYSNAVPQLPELNTGEWGKLETFILEETSVVLDLKCTVQTGPVLSDQDGIFHNQVGGQDVKIPGLFWKVVYYISKTNGLSRAGFLMGQTNLLVKKKLVKPSTEARAAAPEPFSNFEDSAIYQVNLATIEALSGLTFSKAFEPYTDSRPIKLIVKKVQLTTTAPKFTQNKLQIGELFITFRNLSLQ